MQIKTTKQSGITIVELVGTVVIFTLVMLGVAHYIAVNQILLCHSNIKSAIIQELNSTLNEHQDDPNGTFNVTVNANVANLVPTGNIQINKTDTTISGTIIWKSIISTDTPYTLFTNSNTLELP